MRQANIKAAGNLLANYTLSHKHTLFMLILIKYQPIAWSSLEIYVALGTISYYPSVE